MSTEVLYISAEESRALVSADDALRLVEQVCQWNAEGKEAWPPEPNIFTMRVPEPESLFRIKMAALTAIPVVGVRINAYSHMTGTIGTSQADNTRYVVLIDPETARPLAIVDEHWTYNLRTCASGLVALRHLTNKDAAIGGLLGAGQLATTCLEMLVKEFPLREVRVTSRRPESREAFAARMTQQLGQEITPYATAREVVEGADVIITCTSARQHLVPSAWLKEGSTLVALGQDELFPEVYRAADKAIVSDVEVVKEASDIRKLFDSGQFAVEDIWSDLAGIVSGRRPGRESRGERIVIRASGLVTQDVAMCHFVYQEAVRRGMGTRLPVGG